MKISLIGPVYPYRGGIAHFTTLLARKLIEAGHEVQVVSFKKLYPNWLYPGKSDKDYSPGREKVEAVYRLTPLNPFTWRRTVKEIAAFAPQQVIVPWWVTFWGPTFRFVITRLKRREIPVTVLIHNTMPHEARFVDRFLARRTLREADRYIVMTEKEQSRLLGLLPKVRDIDIIPHPIYQMFLYRTIDQSVIRDRLGLPENVPMLLFFGFIRPYKGLDVLLKALSVICQQGPEVHLLVAGEFWENQGFYDQLINHLGLRKVVHIFNQYIPDDEVWKFFNSADVFVAPYTGGTQSGALKTAIGFGIPSVVTDVIRDEIVDMFPEMCFVAPAYNSELLAECIQQALKLPKQDVSEIEPIFHKTWDLLIKKIASYS